MPEPQKNLLLNAGWKVYLVSQRAPGGGRPAPPPSGKGGRRQSCRASALWIDARRFVTVRRRHQASTGVIFAVLLVMCLPVHQHLQQVILLSTAAGPLC